MRIFQNIVIILTLLRLSYWGTDPGTPVGNVEKAIPNSQAFVRGQVKGLVPRQVAFL